MITRRTKARSTPEEETAGRRGRGFHTSESDKNPTRLEAPHTPDFDRSLQNSTRGMMQFEAVAAGRCAH
ncbi:unnamed protein product [Amoebophrya sp. A120]|nr:unnamed protein product [Amoebophrya sp. A120]|eukprot:GSA120T00019560001.1